MIKFHPHSLHNIMQGKFTDTTKKYICQLYDSTERNVHYSIDSKYLEKGLKVEDESIDYFKKNIFGLPRNLEQKRKFDSYKKNTVTFENKYLIGTPDVLYKDKNINEKLGLIVNDHKNSFNRVTFLFSRASPVIDAYYWQLQAYMYLTGAEDSNLVYCLMNTPLEIIEAEKRKLQYQFLTQEQYEYEAENIERMHNFDNLPVSERICIKNVPRNDHDIHLIKQKVIEANDWIEKYIKFNFKEKNEHLHENSAFEV